MRILSIGGFSGLGDSNTCTLRDKCLQTLGVVDHVDTTAKPINLKYRIANRLFRSGFPVKLPDICEANKLILDYARSNHYDIIWIDKGLIVNKSTFIELRRLQPSAKIIGYSPDWMAARHNQSFQFIVSLPFYDCYVTTKSYSVDDLKKMGCRNVLFIGNSYQEDFHRPYDLTDEEKNFYSSDVSFIGSFEKNRADSIRYLADNGIKIKIWGSGQWDDWCSLSENMMYMGSDLTDESYAKAICASRISLCFLRKLNRDLQTTRSVEIPACGAFMLAERTTEHQQLFDEGKEAEFFSTNEELLEKCQYYLINENVRIQIADCGLQRCKLSGYSNMDRIRQIIDYVSCIDR